MKYFPFFILLLLGCGPSGGGGGGTSAVPSTDVPAEYPAPPPGGTSSGTPTFEGVDPEYQEDINVAYESGYDMDQGANARMAELIDIHRRNNGSVKRSLVAKILNDEGYSKANGEKFRRSDIPK